MLLPISPRRAGQILAGAWRRIPGRVKRDEIFARKILLFSESKGSANRESCRTRFSQTPRVSAGVPSILLSLNWPEGLWIWCDWTPGRFFLWDLSGSLHEPLVLFHAKPMRLWRVRSPIYGSKPWPDWYKINYPDKIRKHQTKIRFTTLIGRTFTGKHPRALPQKGGP